MIHPGTKRVVDEENDIVDPRAEDVERLRRDNRRLAVTLGAFSAYLASRGLLEDAWQYTHTVHQLQDEDE